MAAAVDGEQVLHNSSVLWYETLALQRPMETLGFLRKRLRHELPTILDGFVEAGVLDAREQAYYTIKQAREPDQVEKLLSHLALVSRDTNREGQSVFVTFCGILRRMEREEEVRALVERARWHERHSRQEDLEADHHSAEPGCELSAKYAQHLRSVCRVEIQQLTSWDEVQGVRRVTGVSDGYVPMQVRDTRRRGVHRRLAAMDAPAMADAEEASAAEKFTLSDASDLLGVGDDARAFPARCRTMVVGEAGQGKTMLIKHLLAAYVGCSCAEGSSSSRLIRDTFDFVVHISCRNGDRIAAVDWNTFLGLNHSSLDFNEEEKVVVRKYLSINSGKVLIVVDGLDEASQPTFNCESILMTILQSSAQVESNRLLEASVILTSRPCSVAYSLVTNCTSFFSLAGFSERSWEEFCRKKLEAKGRDVAEKCIVQLQQPESHQLKETIMEVPLLAALLCRFYGQQSSLPLCISAVYLNFLDSAVALLDDRQTSPWTGGHWWRFAQCRCISVEHEQETAGTAEVSPLEQALRDVSALALANLFRINSVFSMSELRRESFDICCRLGLLCRTESSGGVDYFSFAHLTLQEWCAAQALGMSPDIHTDAARCATALPASEASGLFWKSVFSSVPCESFGPLLDALRHDVTLQLTAEKRGDGGIGMWKNFQVMMLVCLLERVLLGMSGLAAHAGAGYWDCASFREAVGQIVERDLDLSGVQLSDAHVRAIGMLVPLVGGRQLLNMNACNLSCSQVGLLAPAIPHFRHVNLEGNAVDYPALAKALARPPSLPMPSAPACCIQSLDLTGCGLGLAEAGNGSAKQLAQCINSWSLQSLTLTNCPQFGNGGLESLAEHMSLNEHVTVLNLADCGLDKSCGPHLAKLVERLPCLQALRLNNNLLTNVEVGCLLSALSDHGQISQIHLQNNDVDDNDLLDPVVDFLRARRTREQDLDCHGDRLALSHYQDQDMSGASDDVAAVQILPPCWLGLTGNRISERFLQEVADNMLCGGDSVAVGCWKVTGEVLRRESLRDPLSEQDGRLVGMADDEAMLELVQCLPEHPRLTVLDLRSCGLTDIGAQTLASGLAASKLRLLVLHQNRVSLRGCIALLGALSSPTCAVMGLVLSHNPIFSHPGHEGTSVDDYGHLLNALARVRKLCFLSLVCTDMEDCVGASLLAALQGHASLVFLDLGGNKVADETAHALCETVVAGSTALKTVSLNSNRVSERGLDQLLNCEELRCMEHVGLGENPCCSAGARFPKPLSESWVRYGVHQVLEMISEMTDNRRGDD